MQSIIIQVLTEPHWGQIPKKWVNYNIQNNFNHLDTLRVNFDIDYLFVDQDQNPQNLSIFKKKSTY